MTLSAPLALPLLDILIRQTDAQTDRSQERLFGVNNVQGKYFWKHLFLFLFGLANIQFNIVTGFG